MTSHIIWDKPIYQSDDYYSIAPGVCRAKDGTLIVGFRRNPNRRKQNSGNLHIDGESHVALVRSFDNGETWTDAEQLPHDGYGQTGLQAADFTVLKSGRILLPTFQWTHIPGKQVEDVGGPHYFTRAYQKWEPNFPFPDAFVMTGALIAHSDDNGKTFTPFRPIGVAAEPNHEGKFAVQGHGTQLPDGTILLPGYSQIHRYAMGVKSSAYTSLAMASRDDGLTWNFYCQISPNKDPRGQGFDEHSLFYHAKTGELMSLHRATFDPEDCPWVSRSFDLGKTWKLNRQNKIVGHPIKAIALSDGRTLVVYGYRHQPGGGVRFRVLPPDSTDLEAAPEQIVCNNAGKAGRKVDEAITTDYGYPDATEISPGLVLVVYYFPHPVSDAQIRGCLMRV
jgi:hypothetical protein